MSHREAHDLVADLRKIRPAIYWTDLLLSTGLGWSSFAVAAAHELWSVTMLCASTAAVFALYRALCFTHEISHHRHRLAFFEPVWNVLVGFPLLLPSFMYADVHFDHHRVASYGTRDDPEYLPFAHSALLTTVFCLHGLLAPVALCLRFLVLAPIGLLVPFLERWLLEHASAISMNPHYRRPVTPHLRRIVRIDSLFILCMWAPAIAFAAAGFIPARAFVTWLLVASAIDFINSLRTLAAHGYDNSGWPMEKAAQRDDSIDIPGGIWTELWAPVGLRYHAIHHCFPGIPYDGLPSAYRRLTRAMPETYLGMTRPGLIHCLCSLFVKGIRHAWYFPRSPVSSPERGAFRE